MAKDGTQELLLRHIAEITVMRALLRVMVKQVPDQARLLADFEQEVEELRGFQELSGKADHRFDAAAAHLARLIATPASEPPAPG